MPPKWHVRRCTRYNSSKVNAWPCFPSPSRSRVTDSGQLSSLLTGAEVLTALARERASGILTTTQPKVSLTFRDGRPEGADRAAVVSAVRTVAKAIGGAFRFAAGSSAPGPSLNLDTLG